MHATMANAIAGIISKRFIISDLYVMRYLLLLEVELADALLLVPVLSVEAERLPDVVERLCEALAAEREVVSTVVRVVDVERTLPSLFTFDVVLVVLLG